jgi:DNA-binding Xre family transcriptional regulator
MAKINRLKVVLVEKGETGKWLADQLGKSTCTISKWYSNITLQTLSKIAQLLNVDTRDLLTPTNLQ